MIVGIDPFDASDAMGIYEKILARSLKFTRSFPEDPKSLVKHLIVLNVTKRYGNLKDGPEDVKNHRWFNRLNMSLINEKGKLAEYIPDVENYDQLKGNYKFDSSDAEHVAASNDPFAKW